MYNKGICACTQLSTIFESVYTFRRFLQRRLETVHVVASVTVVTEQQLILATQRNIIIKDLITNLKLIGQCEHYNYFLITLNNHQMSMFFETKKVEH